MHGTQLKYGASLFNKNAKCRYMINQSTKIAKYSFFFLLSSAYFISVVGNISLGISQTSSDDGIISHAISFANPEIFLNDIQANVFRTETPTSLMNLIPALAYQYLQADPILFWIFFLIIQTILYPFSIYGIANLITLSKKQAAVVTILFINYRPQTRNLSYSGDLDWMPYAMWLAESFFVFSIYLYFKKYRNIAFVLITLSCMIHPSLGLWVLFLFVIYDYLASRSLKYSWKAPLSTLVVFFAFLICNYIYIQKQSASYVDIQYLKSVFTNSHFNSISIATNAFDVYAITNSSIIMFVGLTLYFIFTPVKENFILRLKFQVLLKTAYLVATIGITVQAFGLLTENLVLVRLMGTRFTSILAILSFILFLVLLLEEENKSYVSLLLLITFIFFPGPIIVWVYGIRKGIKAWLISSFSKRILFILLSFLSLISSIRLFLHISNNDRVISLDSLIAILDESNFFVRNFFFNYLSIKIQFLLYIFAVVILYVITKVRSKKYVMDVLRKNNVFITYSLIFLLIIGKAAYSSDRFSPRDMHFKQIQEWARNRSAPDASYLVLANTTYGGWRNYSRRAQITLIPSHGPYGVYKHSVAISERITDLVKKYPKDDLILPSKALLEELKFSLSLDYLVTSTDSKKYDFVIAYQNADFIIYKL